jgi:hypothetical protein
MSGIPAKMIQRIGAMDEKKIYDNLVRNFFLRGVFHYMG